MAEKDNLTLGIAAAQSGEREKARGHLAQAVKENPGSEEGWLWLGRCLTEREQQKYCFERVLRLNPQNVEAQHDLDRRFLSSVAEPAAPDVDLPNEAPVRRIPAERKAYWYSNRGFLWTMGIIAGLCICGVPILFFTNSGLLDPLASHRLHLHPRYHFRPSQQQPRSRKTTPSSP